MSGKTLDQYRKALLFAILWQILPILGCLLLYGDASQHFLMGFLLLIVMPLVAGMHYYLLIEKPPRAIGQAVAIYIVTVSIGALAILGYQGFMTLLTWSLFRR